MSIEIWFLLAFALAIAEIVAPGTFLFFFGLGAAVAGLAALLIVDLRLQILVFLAASIVAVVFGRALYRRILTRRDDASGIGTVRVRDLLWLAAGPDLPKGTAIVVVRREGTRLHVRPSESPATGTN
jgi:hypothetical protein